MSGVSDEKNGSYWLCAGCVKNNKQVLLGTESLSKFPKSVEVSWRSDQEEALSLPAIFLPLASSGQGMMSHLLLPQAGYEQGRTMVLRDGSVIYRLTLGDVIETHEDWLRVGFDVQSRELLALDEIDQLIQ